MNPLVPRRPEPLEPHQSGFDLDQIQILIDEHIHASRDVIRVDEQTWAIHGAIPVDGEVILAEFSRLDDARAAIDRLEAAERRQPER